MKIDPHIVRDFDSPNSETDVYTLTRINELDKRLQVLEDSGRVVKRSAEIKEEYSNYGVLKSLLMASEATGNVVNMATHRNKINYVSVYTVEKCVAISIALICSTSLVAWVVTEVPIINPFAALLGLTSSPFFYWMAKVSEKR